MGRTFRPVIQFEIRPWDLLELQIGMLDASYASGTASPRRPGVNQVGGAF